MLEQYRIDPPPQKDSEEYRLMCDKLFHKVWDELIGCGSGGLPEPEGGFDNDFVAERICLPYLNLQPPLTNL